MNAAASGLIMDPLSHQPAQSTNLSQDNLQDIPGNMQDAQILLTQRQQQQAAPEQWMQRPMAISHDNADVTRRLQILNDGAGIRTHQNWGPAIAYRPPNQHQPQRLPSTSPNLTVNATPPSQRDPSPQIPDPESNPNQFGQMSWSASNANATLDGGPTSDNDVDLEQQLMALMQHKPLPREPVDLFRYLVDMTQKRAQSVNSPVEPLKDLTGLVDRDERRHIGCGTFGDVYRGKWTDTAEESQSEMEIVVKVLRSTGSIDSRTFVKDLKVTLFSLRHSARFS
jgi:hypothetical protein